ncbi:MAG TPA: hypothetical protein VM490_18495 [Armatimonadaceae bacterium]|nr:hypothetical protein [Armatimonadaceae bacterium]
MNVDDSGGGRDSVARPAKAGKKAKAARGEKSEKGERGEVLAQVRRLAEDLAALRSEFVRLGTNTAATAGDAPDSKARKRAAGASAADTAVASADRTAEELARHLRAAVAATGMPAVAIGFALPTSGPDDAASAETGAAAVATGGDLMDAPREEREARAARLGFALSSPQKVALARLLLLDGPQGAAQLGAGAGLTTGSLYHHLRDMQHAGVIAPAGRSRFALTPLGSHATLTLLALAARHPSA